MAVAMVMRIISLQNTIVKRGVVVSTIANSTYNVMLLGV